MALTGTIRTSVTPFMPNEAEHRRQLANWIRNAHVGRQLYLRSESAGTSVGRTIWGKLDDICSVKDFGAGRSGDDQAAFQRVYDLGEAGKTIYCTVPAGNYSLSASPTTGSGPVIFVQYPGASFTGAGTLPFMKPVVNKGFRVGTGQPLSAEEGGIVRVDVQLNSGDTQVAIFTHNYLGPITLTEDAVLVGMYAVDNADNLRVWSQNNNIVKTQSGGVNNLCVGIEVSVQNQTTVAVSPGAVDSIVGFFASYIRPAGSATSQASAGLMVEGDGATANRGWKYGVWVDNIVNGGTGIHIGNASGAQSMGAGLITTGHAGTFVTGAVWLGNAHKIVANNTGAAVRNLIHLDASNFLQIGDASNSVGCVINSGGLLLPNVPTTGTASAGTATLPTNPVGFLAVTIGGTDRRIPFYAVQG